MDQGQRPESNYVWTKNSASVILPRKIGISINPALPLSGLQTPGHVQAWLSILWTMLYGGNFGACQQQKLQPQHQLSKGFHLWGMSQDVQWLCNEELCRVLEPCVGHNCKHWMPHKLNHLFCSYIQMLSTNFSITKPFNVQLGSFKCYSMFASFAHTYHNTHNYSFMFIWCFSACY